MIKLHLSSFSANQFVNSLAEVLNIEVQITQSNDSLIEFDDRHEESNWVRGLSFQDDTELCIINSALEYDWEINYKTEHSPYIRFMFCLDGDATYRIEHREISFELNHPLSATISQNQIRSQTLILSQGQRNTLVIIDVHRKQFLEQYLPETHSGKDYFHDLLADDSDPKRFFRIDYYNLAIADSINQLLANEYEGVVEKVFIHAKVSEVLALKIHQLQEEKKQGTWYTLLKSQEVELVVRARNIHAAELQNPPTISQLAKRLGTNENKLKRNFKQVYNKTLNESLTEERLNYAKLLLAAQELNIQQISLEVGYKNPSHFTRLFKQRFGMLPRDFLKTLKGETD